jgi:hypothetical protein
MHSQKPFPSGQGLENIQNVAPSLMPREIRTVTISTIGREITAWFDPGGKVGLHGDVGPSLSCCHGWIKEPAT